MSSLDKYTNSYTASDHSKTIGIPIAADIGLSAGIFDTHQHLLSIKQDVLPESK